jgi:hypothetical protein
MKSTPSTWTESDNDLSNSASSLVFVSASACCQTGTAADSDSLADYGSVLHSLPRSENKITSQAAVAQDGGEDSLPLIVVSVILFCLLMMSFIVLIMFEKYAQVLQTAEQVTAKLIVTKGSIGTRHDAGNPGISDEPVNTEIGQIKTEYEDVNNEEGVWDGRGV